MATVNERDRQNRARSEQPRRHDASRHVLTQRHELAGGLRRPPAMARGRC